MTPGDDIMPEGGQQGQLDDLERMQAEQYRRLTLRLRETEKGLASVSAEAGRVTDSLGDLNQAALLALRPLSEFGKLTPFLEQFEQHIVSVFLPLDRLARLAVQLAEMKPQEPPAATSKVAPSAELPTTPKVSAQAVPTVEIPAPAVQTPTVEPVQLQPPEVQEPAPVRLQPPEVATPEVPAVAIPAPAVATPEVPSPISVPAPRIDTPDVPAVQLQPPDVETPIVPPVVVPAPRVQTPGEVFFPAPQVKTPDAVQLPAPQVQTPDAVQLPAPQVQTPDAVQLPAPEVQTPDAVQLPAPEVQTPDVPPVVIPAPTVQQQPAPSSLPGPAFTPQTSAVGVGEGDGSVLGPDELIDFSVAARTATDALYDFVDALRPDEVDVGSDAVPSPPTPQAAPLPAPRPASTPNAGLGTAGQPFAQQTKRMDLDGLLDFAVDVQRATDALHDFTAALHLHGASASTPNSNTNLNPNDKDKKSQLNFRRAIDSSARGLLSFVSNFVNLPRSAGQLAAQSVQAGAPTSMSTLKKSWDLMIGELSIVFMPLVVRLIAMFQDAAKSLGTLQSKLENLSNWVVDFNSDFDAWMGDFGSIVGNALSGEGFRLKPQNQDYQERWDKSVAKERMDVQKRAEKGEFGEESKRWFSGEDKQSKTMPAASRGDMQHMPKAVQAELKAGGVMGTFEKYEAHVQGGMKELAKGNKKKNYLTDLPPGYQQQSSSFADVRRNLQSASLGTSALDQKKHEMERKGHDQMIKLLERISKNTEHNQYRGLGVPNH